MTLSGLYALTNTPRSYTWGTPGGISRTLGWEPTSAPEAELWLGAHPLSPARPADAHAPWGDLAEWERDQHQHLPYLLKLLSAAAPLSLQAHPTRTQARAGFDREESTGIPLDARERNYKDPHAKPELIVAIEDGFEALSGFRPISDTRAVISLLMAHADDPAPFVQWHCLVSGPDPLRNAFGWLLSEDQHARAVVAALPGIAAQIGIDLELVTRLAKDYPDDPGVAVALMLNHVTLAEGEALWLPAGNIHAYLRGTGMELMGPSDNVLRGGLTPKHVDREELSRVLDFTPGPPPRLPSVPRDEGGISYRPRVLASGADAGFELIQFTRDGTVTTSTATIGIVTAGTFTVRRGEDEIHVSRGSAFFVDRASAVSVRGRGQLFVATGDDSKKTADAPLVGVFAGPRVLV